MTAVWLTGLSGSGKSTIAATLHSRLYYNTGLPSILLDGDILRSTVCKDLGFSPKDRDENISRVITLASYFAHQRVIPVCSFISPYQAARTDAKRRIPGLVMVYLNTPLDVCEERDPKGLYKKARSGEIPMFTGISAPYEVPDDADIVIDTSRMSLDVCAHTIVNHIRRQHGKEDVH